MEIKCTNCGSKYQREKEGEVEAELVECPLCSSDEKNDDEEGESISKIPISQIQKEPKKPRLAAPKLKKKRGPVSKYPKEMIDFIRQNMEEMGNPDLSEAVNKKFGLETKVQTIKDYMQTHKLKRINRIRSPRKKNVEQIKEPKKRKSRLPEGADEFIENNFNQMSNKELAEAVNNKFGMKWKDNNVAGYLSKKGFLRTQTRKEMLHIKKGYPDGLEEFLEENIEMMTNQELADEVKKKFNYSFTAAAIANYMTKRDIKRTGATYKKKTLLEKEKKDPSDVFDEDIEELGLDN